MFLCVLFFRVYILSPPKTLLFVCVCAHAIAPRGAAAIILWLPLCVFPTSNNQNQHSALPLRHSQLLCFRSLRYYNKGEGARVGNKTDSSGGGGSFFILDSHNPRDKKKAFAAMP
jgi:hypothetical protein